MKRILSAFGIGSLTLLLLLSLSFASVSASYVQSPASESSSVNPSNTYTKFMEVTKYFEFHPPQTIDYDNLGWTGTLHLVESNDFGDFYQGKYEGYVQCTGPCPMSNLQID